MTPATENLIEKTFELKSPLSSTRKLISLGLIVTGISVLLGIGQTFVTVTVPQLKGSIGDISWFASIPSFAAPIGSLGTGLVIEKFGRRSALLWSFFPSLLGWILIYLCSEQQIILFLFGRALNGLAFGALMYPQQVYVAECVLVNHQRLLDSFKIWTGIAYSLGSLSCFSASIFLNYKQLAGVIIILSSIESFLIFQFLPESPIWLISQGRYGDAEWCQKRLGVQTSVLYDERVAHASRVSNTIKNKFSWSAIKYDLSKIKRRDVYKPLLITIVHFILIIGSGIIAINIYLINIIGNPPTKGQSVRIEVNAIELQTSESLLFSIGGSVLGLVAQVMMGGILPYSGLRKVSIPCLFLMAFSLMLLGYTSVVNSPDLYFMRVALVLFLLFVFSFGVSNLPPMLMAFALPTDAKGFASVASIVFTLLVGVSLKLHLYFDEIFGGYIYYGYASCALLVGIFALFFLPELVGKSQREISDEYGEIFE